MKSVLLDMFPAAETLIFAATAIAQTPQVVSVSPIQNELNVAVDASISVTFDPITDFAPGKIVTAVLTAGIESSTANPLADHALSFTTASAVAPGIFAAPSFYEVGNYPFSTSSADLDDAGDLDLANENALYDNAWVPFNNGNQELLY